MEKKINPEIRKERLVLESITVRMIGDSDYQRTLDKVESGKKSVIAGFTEEERAIYEKVSHALAVSRDRVLFDGELSFGEIAAFNMKEAQTVTQESLMSSDPFSGGRERVSK